MRRTISAFLLVLTSSLSALGAVSAGVAGSEPALSSLKPVRFTLGNGMKVLLVDGADPGPLTVTLLVDAGWALDPTDAIGTAELTVGSLVYGGRADGPVNQRDRLREFGASLESFVARDYAGLRLTLDSAEQSEGALELLAGILRDPGLQPFALDAACSEASSALFAARGDSVEAMRRALPLLAWGAASPKAGHFDPWKLRTSVAARAASFFRSYYRPERMVLVLEGARAKTMRDKSVSAFDGCSVPAGSGDPAPGVQHIERTAGALRIGLIADPLASQSLALGFSGPASAQQALSRYLLAALVSETLASGSPGAPFPPAGLEGVYFPQIVSSGVMLGHALQALRSIAEFAPLPAQLARARLSAVAGWRESLQDPRVLGVWLARSQMAGVDPDLASALGAISPEVVQATAKDLLAGSGWRAVAIAPEAERDSLAAIAPVEIVRLLEATDASGRESTARGREVVARALTQQGDVGRLRAIRAVETRTDGTFFGLGTAVPIKQRTVVVPPALGYNESVMYRHNRFIIVRWFDGEIQIDRAGTPTSPGEPEQGPLLLRQTLFGPALALVRANDQALVRWLGEDRDSSGQMVDRVAVLDPQAGNGELTVRRSDGALVGIRFDLQPLEESSEEHRYDDFRTTGAFRLPFKDEVDAKGRPYKKVDIISYGFPENVDPNLFRYVGQPNPGLFEAKIDRRKVGEATSQPVPAAEGAETEKPRSPR